MRSQKVATTGCLKRISSGAAPFGRHAGWCRPCRSRSYPDNHHSRRPQERKWSLTPLGRGFLTGRFKRYEDLADDGYRRHSPRFQGENFAKNLELVERVKKTAAGKGIIAGQLALAWVLVQGKDIVPIPGTTRRSNLEQNIAPVELNLTPSDLSEIAAALPPGAASGTRYPEEMMRLVNL